MQGSKLAPTLGLWTSISLVVGGIIGSGIFMKPALMASQLGSPLLLLGIWIVAGLITLCGALSNAEVAAMMPETGGQYVFFQKMYGDLFAFVYGWAGFAVFNTAGVASIAYIFGIYSEYFVHWPRFSQSVEHSIYIHLPYIGTIFPLENIGVKLVTILVVLGLTWINGRSTRSAGNIQVVLTIVKVCCVLLLVLGIFFSGRGNLDHLTTRSIFVHPTGWALVSAIVAAMSGAFWGYDGWNNITFIAGEIRQPQRTIPKALLMGVLCCIVIYTLMVAAYLYVLPIDAVAQSRMVATDAINIVLGGAGSAIIAAMVMISTFGTTNGNILATARVSYAMALEKRFFATIGHVHPKFKTPFNALWLHGIWTSILVLSGSFDMLTDMLIFVSWLFYGLSALGVFVLRFKMKNAERPYTAWGYPIVPAAFVIFTAFFLIATLANDIIHYANGDAPMITSLFGILLSATGIPLYYYFERKGTNKKGNTVSSHSI